MIENAVRMTGRLDPRSGWAPTAARSPRRSTWSSARSAFLILREAFYGTTRFDEFTERVGITDAVAAARLRELVADGLLVREPYREPGQRTRHQYRLTEKGADLFPVLVALMQWGDRWRERRRPGGARPPGVRRAGRCRGELRGRPRGRGRGDRPRPAASDRRRPRRRLTRQAPGTPNVEPSVRASRRALSVPRRPAHGWGPRAQGCQPSVPYSSRISALSSPRCSPQA